MAGSAWWGESKELAFLSDVLMVFCGILMFLLVGLQFFLVVSVFLALFGAG